MKKKKILMGNTGIETRIELKQMNGKRHKKKLAVHIETESLKVKSNHQGLKINNRHVLDNRGQLVHEKITHIDLSTSDNRITPKSLNEVDKFKMKSLVKLKGKKDSIAILDSIKR
jgi:glutamine cyclotransferase